MPKETDPGRLAVLRRVLCDTASNVVLFRKRAFAGSSEPNDPGLNGMLPEDLTAREKSIRLKEALVEFLDSGGKPNRIEYEYPDGDPETIYEFRLQFSGSRVYVKSELNIDDPDDPTLIIRSVKYQD